MKWLLRTRMLRGRLNWLYKQRYEKSVRNKLGQIRGEVFWDIGANIGFYSLMLRSNFRREFSFLRNLILKQSRILSSLIRSRVALVTVLVVIIMTGTSAFALKGYFAPTNEFQAFDIPTSQLSTIYSFSLGDSVSLPTNNFTLLYHSQSRNDTVSSSTLFGSFS